MADDDGRGARTRQLEGCGSESDEEAKTLKREDESQIPGLAELLGANELGKLHEVGPGMILHGRWELLELLGAGSFGRVYEARHVKLGHRMAIKVLVGETADPKAKQRFLEEAQLMSGLSSENLIRASDYDELEDGTPYFVMDLVKGKSLRHWLKERMPLKRVVEIGEQVLAGLVEVHQHGVVHGDIKPENVVIGERDDKAILLDFGLAQTSAEEAMRLGGTPCYMAPEMLLNGRNATVRTDVYSVGAVLYEMLTGRLPRGHLRMDIAKLRAEWKVRRRADPVLMHCKQVPEAQREILESVDRLVMEALSLESTQRPKSAVPMLEELQVLRWKLSHEAVAPAPMAHDKGVTPVTTRRGSTVPFSSAGMTDVESVDERRPGLFRWTITVVFAGLAGLVAWKACPPAQDSEWSDPTWPEPLNQKERIPKRFLASYAGCREVWLETEPRCVFELDEPIRLWLDRPEGTEVTVTIDGHTRPATTHAVPGMSGFRLEVTPEEGAKELVVEIPGQHLVWSLPLRTWSEGIQPPSGIETSEVVRGILGSAFPLIQKGRGGEALNRFKSIEGQADRYPKGKAALATYRGVAFWSQGRYLDAAPLLAEGVSFAVRLHDSDLVADALHMYAGVSAELGYWDAAVEWGDRVLTLAEEDPELIACDSLVRIMSTVGYAHLLRARYRGEPANRARSLLEQAMERAKSKDSCPVEDAMPGITLSLADEALDRNEPDEALDILSLTEIETAPSADQRMRLYDTTLRALDGADRPLSDQVRVLELLAREVSEVRLPEGRWRLALRRGDLLRRQKRYEDAISAYRNAEQEALAIAELAAVGVGRESAVALHAQSTERLVRLLIEQDRPEQALCAAREAQARRIQGVGGVLASDEQHDAIDPAIDRYQRARAALDIALASEKALPRKDREALHIELEGKEQALAKAANDILRNRSTWRPSCDELVRRRPNELLLGLYPSHRGWFVFVQDEAGTDVRELEHGPTHPLDDPALLTELLGPLSDRLETAQRIRVLASERAQDIDVHLQSWRGAPLLEHVPVAYGAELPRSNRALPADAEPTALLLADPTETLPKAAEEVQVAANWMAARGWTLDVLEPREADRAHVLVTLARSSFFYFAGHGVHELGPSRGRHLPPYAGGSQSWPPHLRLKSGSKLEIQDILMLSPAPVHVALLGCETGVPGSAGGGMSLALAFLVAGAEQVVATPVETTEEVSYATGVGLISGMSDTGVDLVAGLRKAQKQMLRDGKLVGRYRAWVR